ncbi:MAG: HD domain-containing protein [Desulfitobacteriaceae bacterium]|nr:HD domain-containing protein [Desulfitobacteriaceae bacterium]MDD4346407.1 HD domain-containing protein [Desulfitobacteriaceae bacterium]MDD4401679.1 HD domain-containing protein [Desulfitobacteriaceae bacterium]
MFYRIKQFYQALFPSISSLEKEWIKKILSPKAFSLFCRQARPEQRHALEVTKSLISTLTPLDFQPEEYENLLIASLLHDCGKMLVKLYLWQKILIVLINGCPLLIKKHLPGFLTHTLNIAQQHPKWGESLAKEAGLNEQICQLIRQHHCPETKLGRILQKNDNQH